MLIPPGTNSQQCIQALPSISMSRLFLSQDFVKETSKSIKSQLSQTEEKGRCYSMSLPGKAPGESNKATKIQVRNKPKKVILTTPGR